MKQNVPTLKSCCKLLHWAGKAYLLVWRILFHLAGVVFAIPPGFCYVIAEFPIAYCCIWHGSYLGTLHSVAFSRVLREYPVGVRDIGGVPILSISLFKEFMLNNTQQYASFGTGSSQNNACITNACTYNVSTYKHDKEPPILLNP